jgi:K+-transporting ATPase KdpF subunit
LGRQRVRPVMLDLTLGAAVSVGIAVYLVYALLYPEKL